MGYAENPRALWTQLGVTKKNEDDDKGEALKKSQEPTRQKAHNSAVRDVNCKKFTNHNGYRETTTTDFKKRDEPTRKDRLEAQARAWQESIDKESCTGREGAIRNCAAR